MPLARVDHIEKPWPKGPARRAGDPGGCLLVAAVPALCATLTAAIPALVHFYRKAHA